MSIASALRSKHAEEFRTPCPVGEGNWKSRYCFLNTLTSAIEQTTEFSSNLAGSLEPYINNITDAAICERTQLSNAACKLIGTLPKALGKEITPYNERFVPTLIRQCASTKTVAQKAASAALSNLITLSPFNSRTLWHVCQIFEDKYSAPKLYAPNWLKLIIENYYPALSPDRDYEVISRAISIGLEEADANVRTNTRAVFWEYYKINTAGAEEIMSKLNTHAKNALMNDPNNKARKTGTRVDKGSTLAELKKNKIRQIKESAPEVTSKSEPPVSTITESTSQSTSQSDVGGIPSNQVPRPLLSGAMRRPRIVAKPINVPKPSRSTPKPIEPPKEISVKPDDLTTAQRINRQELDAEMEAMRPVMPYIAAATEVQNESRASQMYYAYPDLDAEGQVVLAREGVNRALQYLNKDALDFMGFRKLRKLVETYGGSLITDEAVYDLLMSHLLPRLGTFEELIEQPAHEITHENHPRYIRQAVLTMVNILVRDYPFEWSYQYQGQALAAVMIARCAYSVNCTLHEGAQYLSNQSIVNSIGLSTQILIESCINPVDVLDSVMSVLATAEDFLMLNAPHDSEIQKSGTWASFNPYSKVNRMRIEHERAGLYPLFPTNQEEFGNKDPESLPTKLPLLMETGLKIIKALLIKAKQEEFSLGEDREDSLIELARHLMTSYSIIIRREVMEYSRVLYGIVESNERFWAHFDKDSERNLLHYYLRV